MKCNSKAIIEHNEVPLADDGRWEDLIAYWQRKAAPTTPQDGNANRCYVVSVLSPAERLPSTSQSNGKLAEILGLVRAQGDQIVGCETYRLLTPDPRTLLRSGICRDIAARAMALGANLLVLDAALRPSQMRNLEEVTGLPISDREAIILNVFLSHAKTRNARIQVEIAQLEYLRPRIRGLGLTMDQQAGGIMGGRGPGETASELMARRLDARLATLRKAFSKVLHTGKNHRKQRAKCKRIALVGYTNAGKTSLMNALTASQLSARDMPFETLDTTSRQLSRHYGVDIIISDTVGFIRALPKRLLASFESTLAEILDATLLAIVVDVADPEWALHLQTTEALLGKLKAEKIARFYLFNKMDQVVDMPSQAHFHAVSNGHPFMALSSQDAAAVARLKLALLEAVSEKQQLRQVFVPYRANKVMASVYTRCQVIASKPAENGLIFTLQASASVLTQIQQESKGGLR